MSHEPPERWRRISSLFDEAVKLPLAERASFIEQACGEDTDLKARVLELLESSERAAEFLEKPLLSDAAPLLRQAADLVDSGSSPPRTADLEAATTRSRTNSGTSFETIGPYRLLQKIGEGGMGEVWLAEQTEPIHRQVALKLIKAGLDTRQVVARFEAERQALALMDHPGIAKVYDAGATPRGLPYFAMEYVKGEPITTYCDRHRLGTPERLELFARVCDAVQHAHQKGVIHRDLKPSNVLVGVVGDQPQPKVIDFGVAKATAQRLTEKTMFTELGVLIGTPEYMSPEQAEMTGLDVDTRTDVYALGVMLYELLTGALPFESKELREAGFEEIRRRIREVDPPKPSTQVRTQGEHSTEAAKNRQTDPGKLASRLRGDLDWIVMKALEKDRTRRYGTPSELSADLARHLQHEPVLAGPPSAAYRSRKFVRRHRFGVAVAGLAVAGLAAFGVMMALQARAIARERDRAERVSEFLVELFRVSDPSEARGNSITAREVLDRGAQRIDKELRAEPVVQAQMMATMGMVYANLGLASKAEPILTRAVQLRSRLLGQDHPSTLETRGRLASVFEKQGQYQKSENMLQELLEKERSVLGDEHQETLWTLNQLAYVTDRLGRYPESEKIYRVAYEARRRVLGEDHRDTLKSLNGLQVSLERQGQYEESGKLARQVLEARRRTLGEDHPDTAWSRHNVAAILEHQGKYAEAEKLYRESYQQMLHILGADHPDTLWVKSNLASTIWKQGRIQEATPLYEEILETRRRVLGPEHPRTLASMNNVANLLSQKGRNFEAQRIFEEVVETLTRTLGAEHPQTLAGMNNLAAVYADTKRYDEAEEIYEQIVEVQRRVLGPAHPDTLTYAANLASVMADEGRLTEAEKLCTETLESQRRILPAGHPDALFTMVTLASVEVRLGRKTQGLELLREAVDAGFADSQAIGADAGLQTLRDDPQFRRLVEAVSKNAKEGAGTPK
jgi:non-specific serine/threonine protein kinase/serine/threonine-protein kinase